MMIRKLLYENKPMMTRLINEELYYFLIMLNNSNALWVAVTKKFCCQC